MSTIFPTERTAETQNFQFPTENEIVYENPMTFIWIPVGDAKKYTLTVFDDEGFCEKVETEYNFANFPKKLCAKKYFWTVETDTGLLREKMSFTVSEKAIFFDRPTCDEVFNAYPTQRPSYIFSESDIPHLLEDRKGDLEGLKRTVEVAYTRPKEEPPTFHWYPRTYEYKLYFSEHRLYCDRDLTACALLYALTGDEKAGEFGRKLLLRTCDMNPLGPCAVFGYYTDEVGISNLRNLPCAFDMLYPLLDDSQRKYVAKTIAVYAQQAEDKLNAINYVQNPSNSHTGRVPGYLGGAALVLKGTGVVPDVTLKRWLGYALDICCGIFPFYGGNDGSWAEGTFYSSTYTKWYLPFYAAVERFTGKSMLNRPFYHRYTNYLIHFCDHKYENHPFCDCYYETSLSENWPGFFSQNPYTVYADKFGPELARKRRKEYSNHEIYYLHLLDLFIPTLKEEENSLAQDPEDVAVFPDSGYIAMHTGLENENDICVMARASKFPYNSHAHADQGSFALFCGGTSLISPSGYFGIGFGSNHHMGWTKKSKAHNVILVDGIGQDKVPILESVGKFVSVDKENKTCVMDMSTAYPNISKWQRKLDLDTDGLIVSDVIESDEDVEITYCLHALSKPEASGNTVVIERNGKKLTIIPDENLSLEIISDEFDVDLNDGQPEKFHVTEPVQYHIYYKTKKAKVHSFTVEYKVNF